MKFMSLSFDDAKSPQVRSGEFIDSAVGYGSERNYVCSTASYKVCKFFFFKRKRGRYVRNPLAMPLSLFH